MLYKAYYKSPIGKILLVSNDANKLIGLWIEGQKYYLGKLKKEEIQEDEKQETLVKVISKEKDLKFQN